MCNCIRISGFIATKQSKHYEDQVNHYIQTDIQTITDKILMQKREEEIEVYTMFTYKLIDG